MLRTDFLLLLYLFKLQVLQKKLKTLVLDIEMIKSIPKQENCYKLYLESIKTSDFLEVNSLNTDAYSQI